MTGLSGGPRGATPLTEEDLEGLLPTWIATRSDLNQAEQRNIAAATTWVYGQRFEPEDLTQSWLKDLHRRMFDRVWRWAGRYRSVDTNIGVAWYEIQTAVEELVLDVHEQCRAKERAWTNDETAIRFHHRLVAIHPFPNGNGRHARLAADVLVVALGEERFAWGAGAQLSERGPMRQEYLDALRIADSAATYSELLAFARRSS